MGLWLKRLSIVAVLGFPVAVLVYRLGLLDVLPSIGIVGATILLAVIVFFISMVVAFKQRNSNPQSAGSAKTAAILCLLPIVGLGSQVFGVQSVPRIHNISTDIANPPSFDKVLALRGEGSNPVDYDSHKLAALQAAAYPNVKTLLTTMSVADAHTRAISIVESLGWELVYQDVGAGIIEATQTTFIWGFKDDVVVRIQTQGNQTAVDLRSVSRVGESDLGANAKRIEQFLTAFHAQ